MNSRALMVLLGLVIWQSLHLLMVSGNAIFKVEHKYKGTKRTLNEIRARDVGRHGRMLNTVDLPIGGNGQPSDVGLYYTKIQVGEPPKELHVQVDTGSDLLWINCKGCEMCPKKSGLGVTLALYDPKRSSSSKLINCDDSQCTMIYEGPLAGCQADILCQFEVTYADGSSTSGYFVQDTLHYKQESADPQPTSNGTIVFGCGIQHTGSLSTSEDALDGIFGFGQANSSTISQLSAAGNVPKMFSHCLDNQKGGGIFAIGELVEPKVNSTPLLPSNIAMTNIEVDGEVLEFSPDESGNERAAIIDSGSTLTYFPDDIYDKLVDSILSREPDLKIHDVEQKYKCFGYAANIDNGFPAVTFNFANDLSLTVYPHDYLFRYNADIWCVGLMNSEVQTKEGRELTILGDILLANRVVFYDLENKNIGWTEHNCQTDIKVKDGPSGAVLTQTYTPPELMGSSSYLRTQWHWAFVTALFLVAFS